MERRKLADDQVNVPYYNLFKQHVEELQEALTPNVQNALERANDVEDQAIDESYDDVRQLSEPPSTYWTPEEKEIFFRSLKPHSRLRPDLIAVCIKTKNVVDVCVYIELLEAGVVKQKQKDILLEQGAMDEDVEPLLAKAEAEGAMEMSEEWLEFEERQAELLIFAEQVQERGERRGGSDHNSDDPELLTATRNFTSSDLEAMETLLREAEDGSTELSVVPDEIKTRYQLADEEREGRSLSHSSRSSSSRPASARNSASRASNEMPAPSSPRPSASQFHNRQNGLNTPDPVDMRNFKQEEPELDDNDSQEGENDGPAAVQLSPASRRRLQKRLYMRRQRALKMGKEVDVTSVKLRPGRRQKLRRPLKQRQRGSQQPPPSTPPHSRASLSTPSSDEANEMKDANPNSVPSDDDQEYARGNKGGLRAYAKSKQQLLKTGLDAQTLQKEGIGLFHLTTLSKLIKIFTSGYRKEISPSSVLSLLSDKQPVIPADVIRLMTAITVEFVAEVVHRSLAVTKQQASYKRNTKVWRASDNENVSNGSIKIALEMMGIKLLDRRRYFAQLLGESMDQDEGDGDDSKEDSVFPTDYALHRELYEPHVYLPPGYRSAGENDDDDNMVVDDEADLNRELDEEEALDLKDMEAARQYEGDLWNSVYGLV